ncbi:MAG: EAL domain-containing protein [Desulfobacterales bacterium]|nr:MAG: EAL domain-containing protein [Desulfobacterales bacterium]
MNQSRNRMEGKAKWYLENISDTPGKWMIPVEPVPFTIGRDEDCHLTLQSKWVSRCHAQIHASGDLLWIRDLGSTNGTHVNHKQIKEAELLESGDVIGFGRSEFGIKKVDSVRPALAEATFALEPLEELSHLASYEALLQKLLRDRDVVPHFQPILKFADLQVAGYEILGRISASELPADVDELFNVASYLGYASDVSALFREVGVDVGKGLPGCPQLFANTNPAEMHQMGHLVESLQAVREMAPSNRIVVEISEKAVTDIDEMDKFRKKLTELNLGLAYDDFGVGQIRLVELAKAPPDFLKFDISLIHHIHLAPKRLHQMVQTFVQAARDLGIATIAEGIECAEESQTCQQLGFEYAQGYLYGRPLPINEVEACQ